MSIAINPPHLFERSASVMLKSSMGSNIITLNNRVPFVVFVVVGGGGSGGCGCGRCLL